MKKIFGKKVKGFSILEAAFAILLVGIFTSFLIPYWRFLNSKENLVINQTRANYIRKAVEGYVARNGFLPCAATDLHGKEAKNSYKGLVPYKTLGIPKHYIFDSNKKPFTFVVNEHLTLYKNSQNGKTPIPITIPYFYPSIIRFNDGKIILGTHFCRLAGYKLANSELNEQGAALHDITRSATAEDLIAHYDQDMLCSLNELTITQNNKNIIQNTKPIYKLYLTKFVKRFDEHVLSLLEMINPDMPIQGATDGYINERNTVEYDYSIKTVKKFLQRRKLIEPIYEVIGKNCDAIAWILISHHSKNSQYNKKATTIFTLDTKDLVFYQTRFNLAGQLNHPCGSTPNMPNRTLMDIYDYQANCIENIYPNRLTYKT